MTCEKEAGAVYNAAVRLADHEGVEVLADDEAIAADAGVPVGAVGPAIERLGDLGLVRRLGPDADLDRRTIVILGSPGADRAVKRVLYGIRGPDDELAWMGPVVKAWVAEGFEPDQIVRLTEGRARRLGLANRVWDRALILSRMLAEGEAGAGVGPGRQGR